MFRLALSSHIYFSTFQDPNRDTLVFLRSETRDVATRVSGRKWVQSTEHDMFMNGSFCNLCTLALRLALYIFATQCWRALQKERNSCPLLRSCFIGSCHVGVSKPFSRTISLAVYCHLCTFCWLIRSLVDPTLVALIVCGPLQLFSLSFIYKFWKSRQKHYFVVFSLKCRCPIHERFPRKIT